MMCLRYNQGAVDENKLQRSLEILQQRHQVLQFTIGGTWGSMVHGMWVQTVPVPMAINADCRVPKAGQHRCSYTPLEVQDITRI